MRRVLRLARQVSVALSVLDSVVVVVEQVRTVRRRLGGTQATGAPHLGFAGAAGRGALRRSGALTGVAAASVLSVAAQQTRRRFGRRRRSLAAH